MKNIVLKRFAFTLIFGLIGFLAVYSLRSLVVYQTSSPIAEKVAFAESNLQLPAPTVHIEPLPQIAMTAPADKVLSSPDDKAMLYNADIEAKLKFSGNSVTNNGIHLEASNFYKAGGHIFVNICYNLPGQAIRDIGGATLSFEYNKTENLYTHEISTTTAKNDVQDGQRCLNLEFIHIPTDAILTEKLSVRIESMAYLAPLEGQECQEYSRRIQNDEWLNTNKVQIACDQLEMGADLRTVEKPANLLQDEVDQHVGQAISGIILGPWEFTGTLGE